MLVRYFVLRKKSAAMLLFLDAVKAENKGNYRKPLMLMKMRYVK